ncbi:alpha/beta hydrolase [Agrobacterium sp. a22-2]|uniref:alpha/beta hydrolase n=1 Tax=Agrobacterium sp. a22-2 TaxID=2283840 RepID=UPI001FED3E1A|nr:alpha/beta fold hydrolase [Agrobacterium sp. a22-2]
MPSYFLTITQGLSMPVLYPSRIQRAILGIALLSGLIGLGGCTSRPDSAVLEPATIVQKNNDQVTVFAVTNRNQLGGHGGFGSEWASHLSYERYGFSVPESRKGSTIVYPTAKPDPSRQYVVTAREKLADQAFIDKITRSTEFNGTVAVFVHGYNYSYQEALFRTAQMAADANTIGLPILFSWPSAASVTGYVADRDAALYSRSELDRLLQALATAPKVKRVMVLGHSMGGFLTMEAVRQLKLQGHSDVLAKLEVVLAAPDIDVDVFRSQLRDIGRMRAPITLLVAKTDRALAVSSFIGGERLRVGLLDIDDPIVQKAAETEHVRIIDISSVESSDGLGHDRYAALARFEKQLSLAESRRENGTNGVGAFVFDTAGAVVASPFLLAGQLVRR